MNILSIIRVAFRALARNKMRAALTMLGIIIGVSAVIAMVSIGQGAQASVQAQIEGMGTNLLFISAGAQNVGGVRGGAGDTGTSTPLTTDDLDAIKREVPSVSLVSPSVNARSQLVAGNQNWNTNVQGVSEQLPGIRNWIVQSGDFFTDADVRTAARVIVLGQTVADNLFPGMDAVGQTVRVMNLPFRVVGVMTRKGQDPQGRDQDDLAFAPYTSVQKKLLGNTRLQVAYVSAGSPDLTYTAQTQITDLLRQRHKLTPSEPDDFRLETPAAMNSILALVASVRPTRLSCRIAGNLSAGGRPLRSPQNRSAWTRLEVKNRREVALAEEIGGLKLGLFRQENNSSNDTLAGAESLRHPRPGSPVGSPHVGRRSR